MYSVIESDNLSVGCLPNLGITSTLEATGHRFRRWRKEGVG
jgi:hypothetical protein